MTTLLRNLLPFCAIFAAGAATVTIPDAPVTAYSPLPFTDPFSFPDGTTRYQEVFAAASFEAVAPEGILITGVGFYSRLPLTDVSFSVTFDLSTTAQAPDGLSTSFHENVGADNTTVFESLNPVSLSTTDEEGRNLFQFALHQPFVYRPRSGNLLLDIRSYDAYFQGHGDFAHVGVVGDAVSGVYLGRGDSPIGRTGTAGLQVRFTYEPIPEPASVMLFIVGALTLLVTQTARNRRT